MNIKRYVATGILTLGCLVLCGCVKLWRGPVEQKTYLLDAVRTAERFSAPKAGRLFVDRVHALPPFDTRSLITKRSASEYESSFYHELLISPSDNIRNICFNWFAESGLFEETSMTDRKGMTHRLSVSLLEMYGDDSAGAPRKAVVALRVSLISRADGVDQVLVNKSYRESVPCSGSGAEADMRAFQDAFRLILERCETDFVGALE